MVRRMANSMSVFLAIVAVAAMQQHAAAAETIAPPLEQATAISPAQSFSDLLDKADPGRAKTKICETCHNFEKAAGAMTSPPLHGVIDPTKVEDYLHSNELSDPAGTSTLEDVGAYFAVPRAFAPRSEMSAFPANKDTLQRADILLRLRGLSDK